MSNLKSIFENEKTILQLFFRKRRRLVFSLALYRILEQVNGQGKVDCHSGTADDLKQRDCWMCWEKAKLFSSTRKKVKSASQRNGDDGEEEVENSEIESERDGSSFDVIWLWKLVEQWFDEGAENEVGGTQMKPDMFENQFGNLGGGDDEWKNIFGDVIKQLEASTQDLGQIPQESFQLSEKPGYCSFVIKTFSDEKILVKRIPLVCLRKNPLDDKTYLVAIDICQKCLGQISFNDKPKNETLCKKSRCISQLIEHLSTLSTQSNIESDTKIPQDAKNSPSQTSLSALGRNRIQITVVRSKTDGKNRILKPRSIRPAPITARPNFCPFLPIAINPQPSTSASLNPTSTASFRKIVSAPCSNLATLAPSPGLNVSKPAYFKFPIRQQLNVTNLRVLKVLKTTDPKSNATNGIATVSNAPATVLVSNNNNLSKVGPFKMLSAKPLTTLCPNTAVPKGKVMKIFPRIKCVNRQLLPIIHPSAYKELSKPLLVESPNSLSSLHTIKQSQSNKRKRTGNSGSARKKVKKENPAKNSSISNASSLEKDTTTNSSSKMPVENKKTSFKRDWKEKPRLSGSKLQVRIKSSSKKKAIEKQSPIKKKTTEKQSPSKKKVEKQVDAVPMKTIVRNFIAATNNENGRSAFSTTNNRQRRTKPRSAKKLIPVPYEVHYLCIHETLAKKSWKAYWYQKCRCARGEKKKADENTSKDQIESMQEYAPITPLLEKNLDIEETMANEDFGVQDDITIARNTVRKELNNCNNNSSKTGENSNAIDHCASASKHSAKLKNSEKENGDFCTNRNRNKRFSLKKTGEFAKVFRNVFVNGKKKKLTRNEIEKSGTSREPTKTEVGISEKTFKESKSIENTLISCSAFKLHILTMADVEVALSKLDEALSKYSDDDDDEPNTDVSENFVTKPKLKTAKEKAKIVTVGKTTRTMQAQKKPTVVKSNDASDDLTSRQEKVDSVVRLLMKKFKTSSGNDRCDVVNRVISSHVFAQCFEEVDKQPGCLDLISVSPLILQDSPELCGKVTEIYKQKESRKSFLLKPAKGALNPTANKVHANDLECIWAFGKSNNFFAENPVSKSYAKTRKTKLSKQHLAAKNSTRPTKPYLTFKRTMKKFSSNKNPKRKIYRHHSRRPKAHIPLQRAQKILNNPKQEDQHIGIEPYILRWDIPKVSCSRVVGKLESIWGEVTGFSGLHIDRLPPSVGTLLTLDRVAHALTAIKDSSEIFTFSSKPKDGRNTVLLICRKVKENSEEMEKTENEVAEAISPSALDTTCSDNMSDVSSNSGPSKLLLKLKKTGEVSGSAIYSVSDSDEVQDEFDFSDPESSDEEVKKKLNKKSGIISTDFSQTPPCFNRTNSAAIQNDMDINKKKFSLDFHERKFANYDKLLLEMAKKSSDQLPASPSISLCSSPLRSCQESLESDFDQSCSEMDVDSISKVLHSTMLAESPKRGKLSTDGFAKPLKLSDFATPLLEEDSELRVVDWDGELEGKDSLEELLLSINGDSLDILEQTFISTGDLSISPSKLHRVLNLKQNSLKEAFSGFYGMQNSCTLINSTRLFSDRNSFFDQSPTSPHQFQENFSSFDSPETVRGNSQSKVTDDVALPPSSESSDEIITRTPTESMSCSNDESQEKSGKNSGKANSIMKSCNVLLRPLEGMLEDIQRNGAQEDGGETSNPSSQIRFTESSVRELNRLLKNRALNGAYWRNVEFDSNSSASSSSSNRWFFRDRSKKKDDETPTVDIDFERNVKSEEEDVVEVEKEKQEPEIFYPKRKNLGRVTYYRPLDSELKHHLSVIFVKSFKPAKIPGRIESAIRDENSVAKGKALELLLTSDMNFAQVRQWILATTLSHPPPLRSPVFFARKTITSKKPLPAKTSVRAVEASSTSNQNVENSTPKKIRKAYPALDASDFAIGNNEDPPLKKIKKTNSEKLQTSSKAVDSDEFNNLRRQLFQLRHPNYKGDICGDEEMRPLKFDPPACRMPLKLIRVSADQARKQIESSLSSNILLHYKPPANKDAASKRRNSQTSASSSNAREVAFSDVSVPLVKVPQVSLDSILSVSSRGRAIKPSLRNQPLDFEAPKMKKRRRSEETKISLPPAPAKVDLYRPRSRFVNKHSSSGLFIKKIIESGLYE